MGNDAYEAFMDLPVGALSSCDVRVVDRRILSGVGDSGFIPYGVERVLYDEEKGGWNDGVFGVDFLCDENREWEAMLRSGRIVPSVFYRFSSEFESGLVCEELKSRLYEKRDSHVLTWADFVVQGGGSFVLSNEGPFCSVGLSGDLDEGMLKWALKWGRF